MPGRRAGIQTSTSKMHGEVGNAHSQDACDAFASVEGCTWELASEVAAVAVAVCASRQSAQLQSRTSRPLPKRQCRGGEEVPMRHMRRVSRKKMMVGMLMPLLGVEGPPMIGVVEERLSQNCQVIVDGYPYGTAENLN